MNINWSELDNINIAYDDFILLKDIGEELIKYLRNYRQLAQEFTKKLQLFEANFSKKLSKKEEDNKLISQITDITSKATEIIFQSIELFDYSIGEIDERVQKFETLLKDKFEIVNNLKKSSIDFTKNLTSSYTEVNKTKNTFLNSLSKTEEIIDKYYIGKNKIRDHENGLGRKLSDNEYNLLKENKSSQLNEMKNSIKLSKKYEDFHKGSISACAKIQEKFKEDCNSCKNEIKLNADVIANEIKDLVCSFMLSYKNIYKQPLSLIDININKFNTLEEQKEIDKIIDSNFKYDNQLKEMKPSKYQLKSFSHLKISKYLNNEDKNNMNEEEEIKLINNTNELDKKRKVVENLDDGFGLVRYICDEPLIMTIKSIFKNFELIEKDNFDLKFEEGKNKTQKYVLKIIANMNSFPFAKDGFYTEDNVEFFQEYSIDYKREELNNEEIVELIELLNIHENRIIFLQKLSDYRAKGKFALCSKDYILLSQLFNIICDNIKTYQDYHAEEMVIILSQTYFVIDGKRRKYLQESFKENQIFKDKNYWEEFLCYSINKEIMKTLQRDQKMKEDKENSDYKYSNVVFSQILTLIDNMFEFDVDSETVKEILNPKISVYKLNDEFKQTINDIIEVKKSSKLNNK